MVDFEERCKYLEAELKTTYILALKDILDKTQEIEWSSIVKTAKACEVISKVVREVKNDKLSSYNTGTKNLNKTKESYDV